MISIKDTSTEQLNRSFDELAKETFDSYTKKIESINRDTVRVLKLINKVISYRTAQLMLLRSL